MINALMQEPVILGDNGLFSIYNSGYSNLHFVPKLLWRYNEEGKLEKSGVLG